MAPVFPVIDPASGLRIRSVAGHRPAEAAAMADAAERARAGWEERSVGDRGAVLRAAADRFEQRAPALARLMAEEMGKPVAQGEAEALKCAWVCRYYAEHAEAMLADEPVEVGAREAFVASRPLGVVLAIMPWNFPFWQVMRCAAPALMAGDAVLLKHAANVPGCALAVEALLHDAGLPPDLFRAALVETADVEGLIAHPRIAAVSLTGSTAAGRAVAAIAGRELKRCVLELGGSDPYVVLADADVEAAAGICASARLINGGQSCIAAKRFVVEHAVYDRFTEAFVARMAEGVAGDPRDPATALGPLARVDLRDALHDQVTRSIAAGARLALGGRVPDRPGAWYPPTVLLDCPEGAPALVEETFGPVAAVERAADEADAIRRANAGSFGLGAAVFCGDPARGRRLARDRLRAGAAFVNASVRSDPRLPFGGVGLSGFGRELGRDGLLELVNRKTVWVG